MAGAFRTTVWDPTLIIGQIICMQSAFYSAESSFMFLWSFMSNYNPTLAHIFAIEAIKPMVVIQLLATVCCAFLMPMLIGRSRQCLDFAVTLHFIHFLAVCLYNHTFPTQFSWWLLLVMSCSLCTVLGEWLCQKKENTDIPLTQPRSSNNNDNNGNNNGGAAAGRLLEV